MVVEIALLTAKPGMADQLREALRAARPVIASAAGYLGSVFHQGIEEPHAFLLRVEWESLDAHNVGFRQGPLFAAWRGHFQHLLESPPKMTHYQTIAGPA
jgi:heme-degrading monooxygenase HmoA